ncbi:WhiB family transcriptional regulator [Streptomyces sp. NPDC050504]|uniref:WhiB family transcriptional regulator n=1 Tax=Streptomyces sp. NPDC050504 TaxID=3365618 RepID=UPI0037A5E3B7
MTTLSVPAFLRDGDTVPECASTDPDLWFPENGGIRGVVREICGACPYRLPCRDWARARDERGVWGGETETGRRSARLVAGLVRAPAQRETKPCGTYAAYRRHLRKGEQPCRSCQGAERARRAHAPEAA